MERGTPLPRRQLALIVVPLVILVIGSYVGDALAPQLVDQHPLWLMALNPRNRNLVLITNQLDAVSYYVVGTIRLMLSDPLFYLLGFLYGDRAVAWIEQRSSTFGGIMRTYEDLFRRAAYVLVFVAPNNFICLFAGSAGMRPAVFVGLNLVGTLTRLYAIRWLGEVFASPIDSILGFIQDYRWPLTALGIAVVAYTVWSDRRSGKGDLEAITHLESDLEPDGAGEPGESGEAEDGP